MLLVGLYVLIETVYTYTHTHMPLALVSNSFPSQLPVAPRVFDVVSQHDFAAIGRKKLHQ